LINHGQLENLIVLIRFDYH